LILGGGSPATPTRRKSPCYRRRLDLPFSWGLSIALIGGMGHKRSVSRNRPMRAGDSVKERAACFLLKGGFDHLDLAINKITTGAISALGGSKYRDSGTTIAHRWAHLMIKTLYVKGDEADRCTESFRSSVPITITGIDAADERRVCTGAITSMEYAPMPTEHDGRQWRVTIRA
jgi:hypothetical protein